MDELTFYANWGKNLNKVKTLTRELNNYIIIQREKERYFTEKGYFPEEHDWIDWQYPRTKEAKEYIQEIISYNPTKKGKRGKINPPEKKKPWSPSDA